MAAAETSTTSEMDESVVSADPNAARFGLMFRAAMRAQLGAGLVLVGDPEQQGWALRLSPLVELHEPSGSDQALPSQYWRARVALSLGYSWRWDSHRIRIVGGVAHESDHETAHAYSMSGFLTQNALSIGAGTSWVLEALQLELAPTLWLYLLSCTRDRERCTDFAGDTSVGAQLDMTLAAPGWAVASLVPFISVNGLAIAERDRVLSEGHLALHLGVWTTSTTCTFQVFALGYVGNDVGITRGQRVARLGFGVSLTPR